jgi:hypothetical protein
MSDVELGLQADLLPRYSETSDQNTNPEDGIPTVPATQGKWKRDNCCASCHTVFWCILTIEAILYPAGILILSFIKLDVIRVEPNIKETVLARLWQGLMLLPIAIVAQWIMRPESPPVDPMSRNEHEERSQRQINGGLLFFIGIYLGWILSLAFFNEGPRE